MVEPIAHYLIPTLILPALLPGADRGLVLKFSPFGLVLVGLILMAAVLRNYIVRTS